MTCDALVDVHAYVNTFFCTDPEAVALPSHCTAVMLGTIGAHLFDCRHLGITRYACDAAGT